MLLKKEIVRRENANENNAAILGTEIKNRRLSMSMTLAALAEDACSTSYLCKIEKAQIVATDKRLEEICKRVGMTKVQYNDLINLKKALSMVCDYYFYKNDNGIAKLKKSIVDFINYRSNIINYVIAIYENDRFRMDKYSKLIITIIKEISDLDLLVFMTFYSIDLLSQNKVVEASDNIKAVLDKNCNISSLKILQYECLFECAVIANSPSVFRYYEQLRNIYFDNNMFDRCQKLFYKNAIHELINQRLDNFEKIYDKISDKNLKYNINFIKGIVCSEYEKMKNMNKNKLNSCCRLVYLYLFDSKLFKEEIKKADKDKFTYRERLFLDYLESKVHNDRFNFLVKGGIKRAIDGSDGFMMEYFLEDLSVVITKQGAYLNFFETYKEIKNNKRILLQI